MDLSQLADFHAVAQHGGFSRAARSTGTPKATLSRRIQALESALGVRLFVRGARALRLTDEGIALRTRTARLVDDLAGITDEIAGQASRPRGRLRVSVPGYFAQRNFGRFAARFVADYPDVLLEVVVADAFADVVADGFDVVVRANPAADTTLVGQRLKRDHLVAVAAPDVTPRASSDGDVPAVVLAARPDAETWRLRHTGGTLVVRPRPVLRLSSLLLVREAVIAGGGVGLLPEHSIAEEVASGALRRWGTLVGRIAETWVLYPSRRLQNAATKVFVAMLVEAYGRSR